MHGWKWLTALLVAVATVAAPAAEAKRPKVAKTEVSKAVGKCIGLVLGGALLGGLLGGRGGRGEGAAIGAGAGAVACALLMSAAKRQDRIIAAQRAAAAAEDGELHYTSFTDSDGKEVRVASRSESVTVTQPLIPVKYELDGAQRISPELAAGTPVCRRASSELSGDGGSASTPGQIYCRTADGSYEPYAVGKA